MAQRARLNKANILVYGSNGVGKTALIVRYLTKRFIGEYDQNKESVYTHRLQTTGGGGGGGGVGGEMVLEILDPAQSRRRRTLNLNVGLTDAIWWTKIYEAVGNVLVGNIRGFPEQVLPSWPFVAGRIENQ